MKAIVTGTRAPERGDIGHVWTVLDLLYGWAKKEGEPLIVVHGAAPGIDLAADTWCRRAIRLGNQVVRRPYPAHWGRFGKAAGRLRNQQMWTENWPTVDLCVAFPSPLGTGTQHCMSLARFHHCPIWEIRSGAPHLSAPPPARLVPANWSQHENPAPATPPVP